MRFLFQLDPCLRWLAFHLNDGVEGRGAEDCFFVVSSAGGASLVWGRLKEGVETYSF